MESLDLEIALRHYRRFRREYKETLEKIDEINAERFKAGGSIVRIPENPEPREKTIIRNLMKLDKLNNKLSMYQYYMNLADLFIEMCQDPHKSLLEDKFVKCLKNDALELKYCYSTAQINRIVRRLMEKFIEET